MRLIQIYHPKFGRRVALVEEPDLLLLDSHYTSSYKLFSQIIENGLKAETFIQSVITDKNMDYDTVYRKDKGWKILPSFDHPDQPALCMLSGTGLTHKASAENRQQMHEKMAENADDITDSMEMYLWGEEGGKPEPGTIGVQPEWFYKGNGTALRGFGDPLEVPPYAEDGGEEPEIAGIYYISRNRIPYRVGLTTANEFSDHVMEKKNYLYLAPSKLRTPSIGPELVLDSDFQDLKGRVKIERDGKEIWTKEIKSGEKNMAHTLENLEYHHFKYDQHCIPGMVHIHFFGADAFSFGENTHLEDGDMMEVSFEDFGRPLVNPVRVSKQKESILPVKSV